MKRQTLRTIGWLACALIAGCAFDVYRLDVTPAALEAPSAGSKSFELLQDVELDIGHGYERTLKQGTVWTPIGRVSQGDVYRSLDQVLTVEASNIYEAWLVVAAGRVVGFYLPVEDAYHRLDEATVLPVKALTTNP